MRYIKRKFIADTLYVCEKCFPIIEIENEDYMAVNTMELRVEADWRCCDICGKKEKRRIRK